jgi:hypothetical protein
MRSVQLPLHKSSLAPPREENDCGECTACCDVVAIEELGKPHYARCPHLTTKCEIYEERPASCRNYRCAWHMGFLGDRPDWRPDKLGLIFNFNSEGAVGLKFEVLETVAGALAANRDRLKHILARLKSHKTLKNVMYAKTWVYLFPYGADIPAPHAVGEMYAPFAPADFKFAVDAVKGEATFEGNCHELLQPRPLSKPPVLADNGDSGQPGHCE